MDRQIGDIIQIADHTAFLPMTFTATFVVPVQ